MNENSKQRKTLALSIIAIIALLALIVGVAYAALSQTLLGSKTNTVSTCGLSVVLQEPSSDSLTISNALPVADSTGQSQSTYLDFTVTATTSAGCASNRSVTYLIYYTEQTTTLANSNVKLYLTKVNSGTETAVSGFPKLSSASSTCTTDICGTTTGKQLLASQTLSASTSGASQAYRLRMWLKSDYAWGNGSVTNSSSGTSSVHTASWAALTYSIKINVYATAS